MIKEYKKIIIMSVVLLILIIMIAVVLTKDISLGNIKSFALQSISKGKDEIEVLIEKEAAAKVEQQSAIDKLEKTKNSYEAEKEKFDKIDESTVELVKEATKDEKYFIEYLWITLGNYANDNKLAIDVITPGSKSSVTGESMQNNSNSVDTSVTSGAIKIIVKGRYANIADFVYDVENDKELKFKLDNMKMVYKSNNEIEATFSILNLQVKK